MKNSSSGAVQRDSISNVLNNINVVKRFVWVFFLFFPFLVYNHLLSVHLERGSRGQRRGGLWLMDQLQEGVPSGAGFEEQSDVARRGGQPGGPGPPPPAPHPDPHVAQRTHPRSSSEIYLHLVTLWWCLAHPACKVYGERKQDWFSRLHFLIPVLMKHSAWMKQIFTGLRKSVLLSVIMDFAPWKSCRKGGGIPAVK